MNRHITLTLLFALLFLFLIQMIGTLVESIYILDLLHTSLDAKAAGVLFLFSPALLLLLRRYPSAKELPGGMIWAAFAVLFIGRAVDPYLGTSGRLLAAGLAAAAGLLLLPVLLTRYLQAERREDGLIPGGGLALAVALSILLRAMNHSLDVSLGVEAGWLGGLLAAGMGVLIWRAEREEDAEMGGHGDMETGRQGDTEKGWMGRGSVISAAVGLCAALALTYFAFSSPWVISRWTGEMYFGPLVVLATSGLAIEMFPPSTLNRWLFQRQSPFLFGLGITIWNVVFIATLAALIISHSVPFPKLPAETAVVGFQYEGKAYIPEHTSAQEWMLIIMLFLHPVIYLDTAILAKTIVRGRPSLPRSGAGFGLGMLVFVVLIFMLIFTNVWGYIAPISTPFRNQFWLPFTTAGILIILSIGLNVVHEKPVPPPEPGLKHRLGIPEFISIAIIIGITIFLGIDVDRELKAGFINYRPDQITVMTYNLQQGADADGEKAYRSQLEVIRRVNPDVLALQESDTTRISTNNNDYVNYFAQELGYRVYYGPKTVTGTFGTAVLIRNFSTSDTIFTFSDQDENATNRIFTMLFPGGIQIYNVHPDGSDIAKIAFAQAILADAAERTPVIFLGDFNLRESDEAYKLIAAQYQEAWLAVNPSGVSPDGLDMSGDKRIDHIFVSPGLKVLSANYLLPPASASDHPVHWAVITSK